MLIFNDYLLSSSGNSLIGLSIFVCFLLTIPDILPASQKAHYLCRKSLYIGKYRGELHCKCSQTNDSTPARTLFINGLKSRVMKLPFSSLKMMVKSGLEFILKLTEPLQRYLLGEFQNKKSRPHFTIIFK